MTVGATRLVRPLPLRNPMAPNSTSTSPGSATAASVDTKGRYADAGIAEQATRRRTKPGRIAPRVLPEQRKVAGEARFGRRARPAQIVDEPERLVGLRVGRVGTEAAGRGLGVLR